MILIIIIHKSVVLICIDLDKIVFRISLGMPLLNDVFY